MKWTPTLQYSSSTPYARVGQSALTGLTLCGGTTFPKVNYSPYSVGLDDDDPEWNLHRPFCTRSMHRYEGSRVREKTADVSVTCILSMAL